jgi:hypothetical protein
VECGIHRFIPYMSNALIVGYYFLSGLRQQSAATG